ncbi:MAG TPA: GNAT family N-acetyltransferase, partial [bacterium]|nr:GNAT family N-acetyltransferase [bacterium]
MEFPIHPAPYRVVTDRLELRCPEVADVQAIHEGILESLDALRPWMPWVSNDPVPLSERAKVVRDLRAGFDRGKDFTFMVFRRDTGRFVGGMGLHPRVGTGGLELGYWVRTSEQGRGQ